MADNDSSPSSTQQPAPVAAVPPTGLLIGHTFCGRPVSPEFTMAMECLMMNMPQGLRVETAKVADQPIDVARNMLASYALERNLRWLFMPDDDTIPPPHTLRQLFYVMRQNTPPLGKCMVVGGIYVTKTDPPEPIVWTEPGEGAHWNWKVGDVFPCVGLGTGCMLINTDIFRQLDPPWFKTYDGPATVDEATGIPILGAKKTDDIYFIDRVREAGYEIWAHGGVIPYHAAPTILPDGSGGYRVDWKYYTLPLDSYPMRDRVLRPGSVGHQVQMSKQAAGLDLEPTPVMPAQEALQ